MPQNAVHLRTPTRTRRSHTVKRASTTRSGPRREIGTSAWPDLNSQLAAIVNHSNDAIFSRTLEGVVTTWNAAAERIFGYTSREIIGLSSHILVPPGATDEFRKLLALLRRGRLIEHHETERLRKDGRRIQVSLTLSTIKDCSRRVIGFSTIARDITEERRMQAALAEREAELEDLFEQASVGLVLVTPEGAVSRANPAFSLMLDRAPLEIASQPLAHFHSDVTVIAELIQRLARRETVQNFMTEFRTAKGEARFALVDADGLWEQGRLVQTRWFVRDISRRRQLERELLENSDRERRAFAQELHDGLGQQLGGIAYLTNVLRERLTERQAPEAGDAARIFDLLRNAIEDTRRTSRGLSPIPDSPEGLMDALGDLAAQTSELRNIRCRLLCGKPQLVTDAFVAGHLYRIAQEAVNNAVKHAHPRSITLSLRSQKGLLALSIADNGKGIGPLTPNRRGLGLHIMRHRAGLIRGTLDIRGRRPRGTEVLCTVPLSVIRPKESSPR